MTNNSTGRRPRRYFLQWRIVFSIILALWSFVILLLSGVANYQETSTVNVEDPQSIPATPDFVRSEEEIAKALAHKQVAAATTASVAYARQLEASDATGVLRDASGAVSAVWRKERGRLLQDRRHRMEAEQVKAKINGVIRKLKIPRELEQEELDLFGTQHDHELKRIARILSGLACNATVGMCPGYPESAAASAGSTLRGEGWQEPGGLFVSEEGLRANVKAALGGGALNASELVGIIPEQSVALRFESCAVVGNSGSMRGRVLGGSVDSHAAVLRTNQAPVRGYETDVGAKTTLRLLNNVWAGNYVHHPLQPQLITDLQVESRVVATRANPNHFRRLAMAIIEGRPDMQAPLLLANQVVGQSRDMLERFRLAKEVEAQAEGVPLSYKGGSAPSTGFLAVAVACALCDHVTVYGFSLKPARDKSATNNYHYFKKYADSEELKAHPHHSFKVEGDLLLELQSQGVIQVCESNRPADCPAPLETSPNLEEEGLDEEVLIMDDEGNVITEAENVRSGEVYVLASPHSSTTPKAESDARSESRQSGAFQEKHTAKRNVAKKTNILIEEPLDLDPACLAKGSSHPCFKKALRNSQLNLRDEQSLDDNPSV